MPGTKTREKWIDVCKGVAILLVILGHTSGNLEGIWDFSFVYGIHLVMFFLISGYLLKHQNPDRDYINGKFHRLMVPYFLTCFAVLITDVFNSWHINHETSITAVTNIIYKDLLRSFFASGSYKTFGSVEIGTMIGAIWFLPAMFFALLILQLLFKYCSSDRNIGIAVSGIALFAYISARFIWLPFSIQSAMMGCFFMWVGYMVRKHDILAKIRSKKCRGGYYLPLSPLLFWYGESVPGTAT